MAKNRKHWNDYLTDIRLQDSGEYSYSGAYYKPDYDQETKNPVGRFIKETIPFGILALASALAGGVLPATGATDTWYVILPFGLSIVMGFVLVYHLGKLVYQMHYGKDNGLVRAYVYDKTWPRLTPITKVMIFTSILTIIAEVIHLVVFGKGSHFTGALFLLFCMVVTTVSGGVLLRAYNRVKWLKIEK